MPLYIYRAKTHKHTKISGTFYAPNIDGLYAHLQSKHYILIHYRTQWAWKILNPVKDHDLKEWAHMMHFLIKNNITLKDTIYLVAQETSNPTLQETLYHLAYDLEQGSTIHDALQKHERILKPITIICLGMAEKTGNLVHSFERLHDYFTHHIKMKERLWSALR
ncbi:MAG: type II secretion system F family protein, partial [Alphaproteobacteria bacterium]|nr:type II secretion system F family protein [Alphaproteobacteria bacterium]